MRVKLLRKVGKIVTNGEIAQKSSAAAILKIRLQFQKGLIHVYGDSFETAL